MSDLVTKNNTAVAIFDDAELGSGFENVSSNDMVIQRLRVSQKMSKEVDAGDPKYIDGLKAGQFFNSVTHKIYGDSIDLIVAGYLPVIERWGQGEGDFKGNIDPLEYAKIKPTLKDGKNKNGKIVPMDAEGCTYRETRLFFVLDADEPDSGIMLFSLYSTGYAPAGAWLTMMRNAIKGKDDKGNSIPAKMFEVVWKLSLGRYEKDGNTYYQIGQKSRVNAEIVGSVTPEQAPYVIAARKEVMKFDLNEVKPEVHSSSNLPSDPPWDN